MTVRKRSLQAAKKETDERFYTVIDLEEERANYVA